MSPDNVRGLDQPASADGGREQPTVQERAANGQRQAFAAFGQARQEFVSTLDALHELLLQLSPRRSAGEGTAFSEHS